MDNINDSCEKDELEVFFCCNEVRLVYKGEDLLITSLLQRKADALNGILVSDSDPDDPEQYVGLSPASDRLREIVTRQRKSIRRRAR